MLQLGMLMRFVSEVC